MPPELRPSKVGIPFLTRGLLVVLGLVCSLAQASPGGESRPELVGVVVHEREIGTLEVLRRGDEFLLPLDELGRMLDLAVARDGRSMTLSTPLGPVRLAETDLVRIAGVDYVPERSLRARLATEVRFNSTHYALMLDLPWDRSAGRRRDGEARPLVPDVYAPSSSIAGLQGELTHTRTGENSNLYGNLQLRGRFQRGLWKVRLQDSEGGPFQASEYHWFTRRGQDTHLFGRQNLQLHPALGGFDLAGYQFAWNNQRAESSVSAYDSNLLVPRRTRPRETFRGEAPPGSFVQLRIDGRAVAAQQVGFAGAYEFYDVALPSRQISQIEVLVYERHNRQIPVETRRFRLAASDLLLPAGSISHTGGVGVTGIFTEGLIDTGVGIPRSPGGFYQWRQGVTEGITAEAALQYAGDKAQAHAGFVTRLADAWVMNLGLSRTSGATAYNAALEAFKPNWRLFLRADSVPAEFSVFGQGHDRRNHSLEYFRDVMARLTLGLTVRAYDDGTRKETYALPSITWRPTASLFVDARPDIYGQYLGNLWWKASETTRVRFFTAQSSEFEVTHDIDGRFQAGWNTSFGSGLPVRHQLSATRLPQTPRGWATQAGIVHSESRLGYMLAANTPVLPGVQARLEYQSIPYRVYHGQRQPGRLLVTISTDLSQVGGRMVPARTVGGYRERGAIAGRIRISTEGWLGYDVGTGGLEGIAVLVDDRVRGRTDTAGRFYLDNLEPGYHVVELDPEHLPIELNAVRSRFVVEVAIGTATSLDFAVVPEFGIAGRIIAADGRVVADVLLVLLDENGARVAISRSDRFGLYRMDGVAPGHYMLRAFDGFESGTVELGGRPVDVRDDFLFDQDLRVRLGREEMVRLNEEPRSGG